MSGSVVTGIDHVVLTVRDPEAAASFHERILGLERIVVAGSRLALRCGAQKINLQRLGQETRNHACIGSGDLCPLTDRAAEDVLARLRANGVEPTEGPVPKSGARGPITSIRFNDPDGNLVEVARHD